MVLEKISRALTRRTSTYLAAVVASTFFVERAIFGGGDYIFESYNKGVSPSNYLILT